VGSLTFTSPIPLPASAICSPDRGKGRSVTDTVEPEA